MDFNKLDAIAKQLMMYRRSHIEREIGHVYFHGLRVMNGVVNLRKLITSDESHDDIMRAASLFHDCGKAIEPHSRSGSALVGEFLKDELTSEEMREVQRLIYLHDDRGHAEYDMWTKLVQDADILDHYGSMEIWIGYNWSAYNDRNIAQMIEFYRTEYADQAKQHRSLLNYDISQYIFDEKVAFLNSTIDRLDAEIHGNYIVSQVEKA